MKYETQIDPSAIDNSHSRIISIIRPGSRVLDVGCASGILGEYLSKQLGCAVIGIDCDQESIRLAEQKECYEAIYHADLERFDPRIFPLEERYDFIVFGDVLEHLRSPEDLIKKMCPFLKVDGLVVVSLPNVAHGSLKFRLLLNEFCYTDEGLLDRTHVRLFALSSIREFCVSCGLSIDVFCRVLVPIYEAEQGISEDVVPYSVCKYIESDIESWVYQYVFAAKFTKDLSPKENEAITCASDSEIIRVKKMLKKLTKGRSRARNLFWRPSVS